MFPFSYIIWLGIFVALPLIVLWVFNFSYFKQYTKVFVLAVIGAVIFSYPWDIIAVKKRIWFFEEPHILGVWFLGLPIEEWLFILLVTLLFVSITLLFWKRWGTFE